MLCRNGCGTAGRRYADWKGRTLLQRWPRCIRDVPASAYPAMLGENIGKPSETSISGGAWLCPDSPAKKDNTRSSDIPGIAAEDAIFPAEIPLGENLIERICQYADSVEQFEGLPMGSFMERQWGGNLLKKLFWGHFVLQNSLCIIRHSQTKKSQQSFDYQLLTWSGKRESDLLLPYVLLINDFPLICRVVFPNWDAGGDIFANQFLIGFYPSGNCFSSVY